jgi:hypothetical protein
MTVHLCYRQDRESAVKFERNSPWMTAAAHYQNKVPIRLRLHLQPALYASTEGPDLQRINDAIWGFLRGINMEPKHTKGLIPADDLQLSETRDSGPGPQDPCADFHAHGVKNQASLVLVAFHC